MNSSILEVTQALVDILEAQKVALGLEDVYYGDERIIPRTPAIAVIPESKDRVLAETGMTTMNTFEVFIVIYHSRLDSVQVTRKECDELAEQVESLIHQDKQLGGKLYTSHVTSVTPGYARSNKVVLQATRLVWQGKSKTRI